MTVYELSIVSLNRGDFAITHAIASTDGFVCDEDGETLTCGEWHWVDGDVEPEDCPVASRWTICR